MTSKRYVRGTDKLAIKVNRLVRLLWIEEQADKVHWASELGRRKALVKKHRRR